MRHDVEAVALERVQAFAVCGEAHALGLLHIEDADIQLARRGHLGVLLAHAARGGVARVGEQGLSPLGALFVQLLENGAGHIDLAAHDEPRRRVFKPLGQVADGFQILGHVLAGDAVAARRAADEDAVFILQRHGEAVYLRLDAVLPPADGGGDALVEGAQLLKGEDVVEALQRHLVRHGRESALGRAADVLRGRIGVKKLRVRGLQLLEAAQQGVVLEVGDYRRVLVVVVPVVLLYLGAQGLYLAFYLVHSVTPDSSSSMSRAPRRE